MRRERMGRIAGLVTEIYGITPYPEQMRAAEKLAEGNIVDMKTGEGKSLAALMAASCLALEGRKVYMVSCNDYLSERDHGFALPLTERLGIRTVLLREGTGGSPEEYDGAQIVYAQASTLVYDYLRGIRPEYDAAVIDEVDFILVECCDHEYGVSDGRFASGVDTSAYRIAEGMAEGFAARRLDAGTGKEDVMFDFQQGYDCLIDETGLDVCVTERGCARLSEASSANGIPFMYMHEVMRAVLLARHCMRRDCEYVVSDGRIVLIDGVTGRMSPASHADAFLQTALEVKEGLCVTPKSLLCDSCSFPVFFSLFRDVTGLSGTAALFEDDFLLVYGKRVMRMREHAGCRRNETEMFLGTDAEVMEEIRRIAQENGDRPVLVIADSDRRAGEISRYLDDPGRVLLLDNMSLDSEKRCIEELSRRPAVLVSSRITGRGTDIVPCGGRGLVVILAQRFLSEAAEHQALGRCARNGSEGTAYVLTSREDPFFRLEGKMKPCKRSVRRVRERYGSAMFLARKHTYVRSRLFFDQDAAVRERLTAFGSFREMVSFAAAYGTPSQVHAVLRLGETLARSGVAYSDTHRRVLSEIYGVIRLEYRQQLDRCNRLMAGTLFDAGGFHERCREYVAMSRDVICTCVQLLMESAVCTLGKEENLVEHNDK